MGGFGVGRNRKEGGVGVGERSWFGKRGKIRAGSALVGGLRAPLINQPIHLLTHCHTCLGQFCFDGGLITSIGILPLEGLGHK